MRSHLCLEWKNLEYSVPAKSNKSLKFWRNTRENQDIKILDDISGCLDTGELVAILGPSGAGKTTLLAAISQRLRGNLSGKIYLNGNEIDRQEMTKVSCFLPQFDISMKALTAFEHLFFMCYFKMDKNCTKTEKIQKVNDLLLKVGLREQGDTGIMHLSGGERKRLSLAEELIAEPPFVFCDEPTTGLDSYNAYSVVKTLRNLTDPRRAHSAQDLNLMDSMEMLVMPHDISLSSTQSSLERLPKGVLCSIHQPTSDVFELFTHIVLIYGGSVVYQGSSDDACLFFNRLGFICPRNCLPSDFYIKLIADSETEANYSEIIKNNFQQEAYRVCKIQVDDLEFYTRHQPVRKIAALTQIFILLWRNCIQTRREFRDVLTKTGVFMVTAVTLAVMYSNVRGYNQSSVQDIQGSIFMFTTEIIFTFSYSVIYDFPSELPFIRREVGENIYRLWIYYVAQVISLIPKAFITSYIFLGIIYSAMSYSKGILTYLSMALSLSLSAVSATSYGFLLSSIFESNRLAAEIAIPIDLYFLIFGGLYYNVNAIPFAKYTSMFYYANEALTYDYWYNVNAIECLQNSSLSCLRNGTEVLSNYSFHSHPLTLIFDYAGLLVLFFIMHFFAYINIARYVNRAGYY